MGSPNLEQLMTTMAENIHATLPLLQTCAVYPILLRPIKVPAVLLEITNYEPVDDVGTEQLMLKVQFEAHVITGPKQPEALVCEIAKELTRIIHQSNWQVEISAAKVLSAQPNGFKPELDSYNVWTVTWEHTMSFGDNVWDDRGVVPETVYVGTHKLGS